MSSASDPRRGRHARPGRHAKGRFEREVDFLCEQIETFGRVEIRRGKHARAEAVTRADLVGDEALLPMTKTAKFSGDRRMNAYPEVAS